MRNLLYFLLKHSSWIVYTFYVILSCVLLFRFNPYHQSAFFSSANEVSARVYDATANVTSYFNLRDINSDLQVRNGMLEMEVVSLREQLQKYKNEALADSVAADTTYRDYTFIIAQVIKNSVTHSRNYITLDKGSKDGIRPEMGVLDQNGIVGIINVVSENYSQAISLLNSKLRLSCKVKGSDYFGSLVWDGKDARYAVLEELPRHVNFSKGDTIITSGYSAVFPEGIIVGTVSDYSKQKNDNFYALKVRLSSDFACLSTVRVIASHRHLELKNLEQEGARHE